MEVTRILTDTQKNIVSNNHNFITVKQTIEEPEIIGPVDIPTNQSEYQSLEWKQVAKLSDQCAEEGSANYKKLLGYTKDLQVGTDTVKTRIVGINHDTFVDGTKAGFTFQLTDGLPDISHVINMWYITRLEIDLNKSDSPDLQNILNMIYSSSSDVSKFIQPVKKLTIDSDIYHSEPFESSDRFFFLSLAEAIGVNENAYYDNPIASDELWKQEGTQYEYYSKYDNDRDQALESHIIKDSKGSPQSWHVRTYGYARGYRITDSGDWDYGYSGVTLPAGAFCLSTVKKESTANTYSISYNWLGDASHNYISIIENGPKEARQGDTVVIPLHNTVDGDIYNSLTIGISTAETPDDSSSVSVDDFIHTLRYRYTPFGPSTGGTDELAFTMPGYDTTVWVVYNP